MISGAYFFLPDNMRSDLRQAHSLEIETVSHDHQQQLAAARMELERSIELTRQKVESQTLHIFPTNKASLLD